MFEQNINQNETLNKLGFLETSFLMNEITKRQFLLRVSKVVKESLK